jgi:hypothetical protein
MLVSAEPYTMGLTERAFDLIGDVRKLEALVEEGASVGAGQKLMDAHWEGYKRGASDELYHARWSVVADTRGVSLPVTATVLGLNPVGSGAYSRPLSGST